MIRRLSLLLLLSFCLLTLAQLAVAADPVYREKNKYPTLDKIKALRDGQQAVRDSIRDAVDAQYAADKKAKDAALDLRVDWSKVKSPKQPGDFKQIFHLPPTPQFYTGTCWAFCSTSFLETEAQRLAGVEIKLSEMWTVYWEYVEKSRSYLNSFGHTPLAQGGQDHGTLEVMKMYGAMTHEMYPGVLNPNGWHDHSPLQKELKGYLDWAIESGSWDVDQNLDQVKVILNKHLGTPPLDVIYDDKSYSPKAFQREVLKLNPEDYVACVSRMDTPFYARVLLDVHDNWRRKDDYLNLPLHDFYEVIKKSMKAGYSLSIGGDNSEVGMDGKFDTAIVPEWDIPSKSINQASREFRIVNGTTGDDHGVHVVGYTKIGGKDWFLIKDSNRSSRLGKYKGYYFWSGDYIRLKMLSFTVHKDMLDGLLN